MIPYFIELAVIHSLLSLAYFFVLSNEKQYKFMRWYLLLTIPIAMIVPLISIESIVGWLTIENAQNEVNTIVGYTLSPIVAGTQSAINEYTIITWTYLIIAFLFLIRLSVGLFRIIRLFAASKPESIHGVKIRLMNTAGSFTFFNWIFLNEREAKNPQNAPIIEHEKAHSMMLHSIDILLINCFTVFCWFLPSAWWVQKEIKKIHEYEADRITLKKYSLNDYSKTLINYTLKSQGWGLANSIHDGLILKRIHAMKNKIHKTNQWKIVAIVTFSAMIILTFSCNDQLDEEIEQLAEHNLGSGKIPANAKIRLAELRQEHPDNTYAYKELAVQEGEDLGTVQDFLAKLRISGRPLNIYYHRDKIGVIVREEELKIADDETSQRANDQIFTIVEDQPEFPGGLEAFYEYFGENMKYPEKAKRMGIEGRVYVQFVVDTDGTITEVQAVKGIGGGCDEEAERVMKALPAFKPGIQKGQNVKVRMVLPVIFKLDRQV